MFHNIIARLARGRHIVLFFTALLLACLGQTALAQTANAATYYVSPAGNDGAAGTSTATAWKTFSRAWQTLQPGDTLLLLDGTYTESLAPNVRNGQSGLPITVRALNDGKAVIDGQGTRRPIQLGDNWGSNGGPIGDWYVVEGIVARNGTDAVVHVKGNNNVLRRVSAYSADVNMNSTVVLLWGNNNLVEDTVAAGTGRYMFEVYQGNGNTLRRIFAQWERWDGRQFCGVQWPHGYNVGVYNASNTTVENAIAYGRAPAVGILVQANADNAIASNNAVLGSMALLSGRDRDGSLWTYGTGLAQPTTRPLPSDCSTNVTQWSWGGQRVGFALTGQGAMQNNVFRDVLASNNVGVGFVTGKPYGIGDSNTTLDHATFYNNAASTEPWEKAQGGNILLGTDGVQTVTNSRIAGSSWPVGEGARFNYRYVNRKLTNQALFPWPMESRIQNELGLSVRNVVEQFYDIDENIGGGDDGGGDNGGGGGGDTGSFDLTITPDSQLAASNATVEIKATVAAVGAFARPVQISVASASSGIKLEPSTATINAPGEAAFQVTTSKQSGVYILTFTAHAQGASDVQRQVSILVNPQPLFLPAIIR